ncbi:MAG: siphovirus Gp157 family protein [Lachnospiraceae bacterium]|nr:siphovirus Gp157 family protein [Lachnospiraceae bacterium]
MSAPLYNLSNEFQNLLYVIESQEDESPDGDIISQLEEINEEFDKKASNIAIMINTIQSECDTIKAEIDRLKKRCQSRENQVERLKNYLKDNMMFCGKHKISSPTHTISIRNNYRTDVSDEFIDWAIEHDKNNLLITKTTCSPDKKLIKEEIESGNLDCPYVKITESQSVVIK